MQRVLFGALLITLVSVTPTSAEGAKAQDAMSAPALPATSSAVSASYTVAVMPFSGRLAKDQDHAAAITEVIYTRIAGMNGVQLVERERLDDIFSELALSKSGIVEEESALRVARLAGAQFYVFGKVTRVSMDEVLITVKLVSVETTKLTAFRQSFMEEGEVTAAAAKLAGRIHEFLTTKAETLLPREKSAVDPVADLLAALEGQKLPGVYLKVTETHREGATSDPASEIKLLSLFKATGFDVYRQDPRVSSDTEKADLILEVEAVSSDLVRRGELFSCAGRVEIKVHNPASGKILSAGEEEHRSVDVSSFQASKASLSAATERLAVRLIPEMVRRWNKARVSSAEKQ